MKIVVAVSLLCFLASVNAGKLDKPSSYIINGQDVSSVIPYYGYLEIYQLPGLQGNIFFGGATLISTQAVITVAQNAVGFGSWRVGLGATRIEDLEWSVIASSHVHPNYNSATLGNNIAVLQLAVAIQISPLIAPITRLPSTSVFPTAGAQLHIVGFGFGATENQPIVLQEAQLTVITETACGNAFPHLINNNLLGNHFCASNTITLANLCAGDQGGPIVDRDLNIVAGLQSFNRDSNCGILNSQPAAFIRVNQYNDFINQFL
jgi:secreted trypsin-like serine protease